MIIGIHSPTPVSSSIFAFGAHVDTARWMFNCDSEDVGSIVVFLGKSSRHTESADKMKTTQTFLSGSRRALCTAIIRVVASHTLMRRPCCYEDERGRQVDLCKHEVSATTAVCIATSHVDIATRTTAELSSC